MSLPRNEEAVENIWKETRSFHPDDDRIRATKLYVIQSRPKGGVPIWRHVRTGKLLDQFEVMAQIMLIESKKAGLKESVNTGDV